MVHGHQQFSAKPAFRQSLMILVIFCATAILATGLSLVSGTRLPGREI